MAARSLKTVLASFLIALAIGFLCSLPAWFFPNNRLNTFVYDQWMKVRGVSEPHPGIAIVDIDEASISEFGQWPWPRHIIADLAQKLLGAGAAAIGLDLLLSESDRTSLRQIDAELRDRYGHGLNLDDFPAQALDNDEYFRDLLAGNPIALGAYATYDRGELPPEMGKARGIAEKTPAGAPRPIDTVPRTRGLLLPLKQFVDAAPIGLINVAFDNDGIIRAVPLVIRAGDNLYASLSLRALMLALKRSTMLLESNQAGLARLRIGKMSAPLQRDGMFRPVFRGPARTFPYISAKDVLFGNAANQANGKIVFIGSSATGLVDQRPSPFDLTMPGVEFHATIVDNILSGLHIIVPYWDKYFQVLAAFAAALLATAIFGLLPLPASVPLAALLSCLYLYGSWRLFQLGMFVTPVNLLLATMLCGAAIISWRFWREQKGRRQIRQAFSRYVAPEAVARIAENGTRALEGEQKEISILFTDVRNFTTISGNMEPGQIVRLLNSYFTPMTACVKARHGTLDKFIGDAMMAFWNAPLDVPNHQRQAVLAALEMQRTLAQLRPNFQNEFNVELRMGVGIHCGTARVGNMGSLDLLDYTCIGDNVNLASRLEGLCKMYGADIIVSSHIVENVKDIHFRQLDRVRVKGSQRALAIFTPLNSDAACDTAAENLWQKALAAYFDGDFNKASELFRRAEKIAQLQTAARMFVERCAKLAQTQPKNWDGVFTYTTK